MAEGMTVGFIGLGDQGAPIAKRIADAGFRLHIWARRAATLDAFPVPKAVRAASPLELGAICDLVGVCVVNDDDVREVVLRDGQGVLFGMKPGSILAIHSTLLPATVVELDRMARERGIHLLDAPVSGGSRGATAGTMSVLVGGDDEALARARPVFETFAAKILLLGPAGAGQMMKLLNNNLCYANLTMAISALELAVQLKMDRNVVIDVLCASSGGSVALNIAGNETTLCKATGPSSNIRKDVHHFVEALALAGIDSNPISDLSQTTADRLTAYASRVLG